MIIVERAQDIGPDLGAGPRAAIETSLRRKGVAMRLGHAVAAIDAHGATMDSGEYIESDTVI